MATDLQKNMVVRLYRALEQIVPNFIARQQQKDMITKILGIMSRKKVGLIEAPTGTGKSMGYLIPGLVTAVSEDKVLVISTATASLQDQLYTKDIPLLLKAFSFGLETDGIEVVVAKGRERHACPIKMQEYATQDMFSDPHNERKNLQEIHDLWRDDKWMGMRDDLPIKIPIQSWMKIANTAASCAGQNCPSFDVCPYYQMQTKMKTARAIITNHDYLLSTLSNVPNSIFSNSEKCMFIFDEAHHLGDKLLNAFARKLNFSYFWDDQIQSILHLAPQAISVELRTESVKGLWKACEHAALTILGDGTKHQFSLGEISENFKALLKSLIKDLSGLRDSLKDAKEGVSRSANKAMSIIAEGKINELTVEIEDAIACITEFTNDEAMARWVAKGGRYSVEMHCSPFDGAKKARKHLWPVAKTAVLASATITTAGSFDSIKISLGMPDNIETLRLESPFDYSRAKMIVPKYFVEATNPSHSQMVSAFLKDKVSMANQHKGILVYFTSKRLMSECFDSIPSIYRKEILMQGMWQPWAMIAEHKKRIDQGQRSILFGLDSMGEGVDLPGNYCTQVIMTRIPFPSPDDPILATHAEFLEHNGKDPFRLLTLPRAGLKFAQVAGRLMRRESDWGELYVLDKRLCTKKYGQQLLRGTSFLQVSSH